jgi:DNA-binding NarL/FixJ family response regulator
MKILVIDDHVLIREAMHGVLRELKGEAAVILEASDSRQAMCQIEQNPRRGIGSSRLGVTGSGRAGNVV